MTAPKQKQHRSRFLSRSLHWDGEHGNAVFRRGNLPLKRAPKIGGKCVLQVSYSPFIEEYMILDADAPNRWRPMTDEERLEVDDKLERMVDVGLTVWD